MHALPSDDEIDDHLAAAVQAVGEIRCCLVVDLAVPVAGPWVATDALGCFHWPPKYAASQHYTKALSALLMLLPHSQRMPSAGRAASSSCQRPSSGLAARAPRRAARPAQAAPAAARTAALALTRWPPWATSMAALALLLQILGSVLAALAATHSRRAVRGSQRTAGCSAMQT